MPEEDMPPVDPTGEPAAQSAGEESQENVDKLRGGPADAPRDPDVEIDDLEIEEVEHDGSGS